MDFNAWLQTRGIDPTTVNDPVRATLQAAWRAEQNPPAPNPTPTPTPVPAPTPESHTDLDTLVRETQAENSRRASITALVATALRDNPNRLSELEPIGRLAIEGRWSVQQTELQLLRLARPVGPHVHIASQPQVDANVIEASVCRAAGMRREDVERHFDDRALTAADRHYRSGVGLQRLLLMGARANGYRGDGIDGREGVRSALKYAFRDSLEFDHVGTASGPSTVSVSGILSNVANKFAVDAFNAVESEWRKITAIRPVTDFKEISSFALTGDLTYQELAPGGKIKHGTLSEEAYGNRAKLYALQVGLDYQQIRNDDLNAFAKITRMMARGGALKINKVFWTEWVAGQGSFWSTANGNYRANTDVAFALAGLAVAAEKVAKQTDPFGEPLGTGARYLLVPTPYDVAARTAMSSTLLGRDDEGGTTNVLAGKWEVVAPTYLDNSSISGSSATNYWLVRDPADIAAIETCLLDGAEAPVIESAEADFDSLGMAVRAYHGFGVRKQEPVGAHKFKVTAD